EHVDVDHDEEQRGTGGVHVPDQPAPLHVAHDVLDGGEGLGGAGLVVHGQEDPGQDLVDQDHHRQHAEVVPDVEVLRRVVLGHVLPVHRHHAGRARVDPVPGGGGTAGDEVRHGLCGSLRIDADDEGVVIDVVVRRHDQVGRRRHALVDATGHVEL